MLSNNCLWARACRHWNLFWFFPFRQVKGFAHMFCVTNFLVTASVSCWLSRHHLSPLCRLIRSNVSFQPVVCWESIVKSMVTTALQLIMPTSMLGEGKVLMSMVDIKFKTLSLWGIVQSSPTRRTFWWQLKLMCGVLTLYVGLMLLSVEVTDLLQPFQQLALTNCFEQKLYISFLHQHSSLKVMEHCWYCPKPRLQTDHRRKMHSL